MSIKIESTKVYEMTCTSCEKRVERTVKKLDGVIDVKASFSGQFAEIEYNDHLCDLKKIKSAIQSVGYSTESPKDFKFIGIMIAVAAVVLLGINTGNYDMESHLNNASYAVLFVVGVITSIHCVGMCGGIMLSQSIGKESMNKFEAIKPALLYNAGRVVAYTVLGGVIGAIGSVFALSLTAKAGLQLFAGVFMIMMGFNMAGFKAFRKFQIKMPNVACKAMSTPRAPFFVGLLNGLMPCGPLQTMQIFALGTGSAAAGALSMFMFSIGTVPLMLTFGALSGLLTKGYTKKILKFSGVLIIMLGLIMSNRGLALAGMNISPMAIISSAGAFGDANASSSSSDEIKATIKDGVQVLNMTANVYGYTPKTLYVQKGMPLKWVINGEEITGCNNTIVVPGMDIEQKLQSGNNLIEFTPGSEDLNFSCWMGMKRGVIKVVDDLEAITASSSDRDGVDSAVTAPPAEPAQPSIYGDDFSKAATDRLVKKAEMAANEQTITIKGTGYEFEPLIMVVNKGISSKMAIDLSSFDNAEGYFMILNSSTMQIVADFTGTKGVNNIEFTISNSGSYGIYLNEKDLLGIIEVVDDLNSVDLEEVRAKYIQ
ncbi:sulfite exporter TauE/SafE/plastocyanin domain-containing protein/copper chaperone CopZ [Bacillus niacini]|uniref:Sulfite exporter TauE/SafE/plastocyanin domain-containing protein/copper chaperone CopZ n=1 Tax=Neobacillus niacini TaxID=86668 RepID=A0A852TC63_9BACI|nr:sulfite exporter TauE/SafE family protein [Neobacillus niacini]NYE04998.1 sulfite exporter TauE/SafE/plastocyanin domain-containing protein/copper chaperone CopZ [Neobacillus niacini]